MFGALTSTQIIGLLIAYLPISNPAPIDLGVAYPQFIFASMRFFLINAVSPAAIGTAHRLSIFPVWTNGHWETFQPALNLLFSVGKEYSWDKTNLRIPDWLVWWVTATWLRLPGSRGFRVPRRQIGQPAYLHIARRTHRRQRVTLENFALTEAFPIYKVAAYID